MKNALFCMYSGLPEPPTLNAIAASSDYFDNITFLRSAMLFEGWNYPKNVNLVEVGQKKDIKEYVAMNFIKKMQHFFLFCYILRSFLKKQNHQILIVHDYLGLLAAWLVNKTLATKTKLWFNSYDVIDLAYSKPSKYSLMNIFIKNMTKIFAELDFFSLPAKERLSHYPIENMKGEYFVMPNYPAISFYTKFYKKSTLEAKPEIRLIYQGALGKLHGYEQIIPLLNKKIKGKKLRFILKGWIYEDYKQELIDLARQCGVETQLSFEGFSSYTTVPELASTCDIGLAIFTKQDIMNKTLGSASNKIYEYAAVGLPVLLYDTPHFREYLGNYEWAFFTDLSENSLLNNIENIVTQHQLISQQAHESFLRDFNYEKIFAPVIQKVLSKL
jgi:glycosyltransferase involved in cell wall biosynthesis